MNLPILQKVSAQILAKETPNYKRLILQNWTNSKK
jgi:hypothetical protein